MALRHEKLGIKQTIQKAWMDKTLQMLLAGLSEKEIRLELDDYLSTQKQSGGFGERGKVAYKMAIGPLSSWFSPDPDLLPLRDEALIMARRCRQEDWLPLHWLVLSASYPFWFNVARQVGRLFNLQEQVTQAQIFARLKEQYGDRETVARNARYVVRSFVAWGVIKDSTVKGCYEKTVPMSDIDPNLTILLLESALLTFSDGTGALGLLLNSPGFFPFQLSMLTGDTVSQRNHRIDVVRYGLDDELLKLTPHRPAVKVI